MTLDFFQCFNQRIQSTPNQIALQYADEKGSQSFTYSQIHQEASKIGMFLQQQGIGPGDAVGILMENHPRWGIAFLAAQSAGARIVPFDVLHNAETLSQLIQHAQCKFLISSDSLRVVSVRVRQWSGWSVSSTWESPRSNAILHELN